MPCWVVSRGAPSAATWWVSPPLAALDPLIAVLHRLVAVVLTGSHEPSSGLSVPRRGGWLPLEAAALPFAMAPTRNRQD